MELVIRLVGRVPERLRAPTQANFDRPPGATAAPPRGGPGSYAMVANSAEVMADGTKIVQLLELPPTSAWTLSKVQVTPGLALETGAPLQADQGGLRGRSVGMRRLRRTRRGRSAPRT